MVAKQYCRLMVTDCIHGNYSIYAIVNYPWSIYDRIHSNYAIDDCIHSNCMLLRTVWLVQCPSISHYP